MKKNFFMTVLILTGICMWTVPAFGHTYWIDTDNYSPAAGDRVNIFICGGHHFPESGFAVGDKVLAQCTAYFNGKEIEYKTEPKEKKRVGTLQLSGTGVYLVTFTLKRPHDKAPRFEARSILHAGAVPEDAGAYRLGNGLEIVPVTMLAGKKKGDALKFKVLLDGKPVAARCSVTPSGQKRQVIEAEKDTGFSFKADHDSNPLYLLTASINGRGCSLTFRLTPKP